MIVKYLDAFRPFLWLWVGMAALAVFKILDEVPDAGWEFVNLWGRRSLLVLFFVSFGIWFYQNVVR